MRYSDADVDFIKGMIPHHQGAVDMGKVVLQYGTDPDVRNLAQHIIADQQIESVNATKLTGSIDPTRNTNQGNVTDPGAATAGAAYTATEQAMLQAALDLARDLAAKLDAGGANLITLV